MKKVAFLICILFSLASAQVGNRQYYTIENFQGLNLVTDSIDLPAGQAVQLDNFVLDRFGALHKRYGIEAWNDSLISADTVRDIHYVEDKNGDKMLFIATNNYVYELKDWTDTVDAWAGKEIDYTRGQIDTAISGEQYVYGDTTSWILVADIGDQLVIGDSTYTIDSILTDTSLHVSTTVGTHGDGTYRLIKTVRGIPQLASWNGNLYVADDGGEPWWYDGTQPYLLGIIDSGTVSTAAAVDTTIVPYDSGSVIVTRFSNIVYMRDGLYPDATLSNGDSVFATGNVFKITYESEVDEDWTRWDFESRIAGVDTLGDSLFYLADAVRWNRFGPGSGHPPDVVESPISTGNRYSTWHIDAKKLRRTTKHFQYIEDTLKNFEAEAYRGFWIVHGNNAKKRGYISGNADHLIDFDSTGVSFAAGDRYYVARQISSFRNPLLNSGYSYERNPWAAEPDTSFIELSYFKKFIFHRNRLYAIGFSIAPTTVAGITTGDTINTGRIWLADLGLPAYIPSDFNFDISGAGGSEGNISLFSHDATQAMFILRDDLYIITNSNIYRLSGEPDPIMDGFGLYLTQIVRGVGSNQPYGIVTTKDNIAYIMNQQGIWLFDGNRIEKISYEIDPLVERYRESRMAAGKFKDNLFFSYPDSGVTLVFHYPTKQFTRWQIGMGFINDQAVAIDSNYFLFSNLDDSGYVLQYPRNYTNFTDILTPGDTSVYVARYRGGWQTFGLFANKSVEDIEITAFNPDVSALNSALRLRKDWDDSIYWDSTAFATGERVHAFRDVGNAGAIWGKSYQVEVMDSTIFDFFISNMRFQWYPVER